MRRGRDTLRALGRGCTYVLHEIDQRRRNEHGNERERNLRQWNIGERQGEHRKVGEQIAASEPEAEHLVD